MKYRLALIVGRFQPFHKGHLFLIKKALEKAEKIVIGIGSANIIDENNPIDFETRKKIIKAVVYKEKIEDRLIKVVSLDDFFDDKKWLKNLKKQVGKFEIALGNNNWTNKILKNAGYKVLKIDYYKRNLYEGWRIRKLIKEGKKWQNRVPKYLTEYIKNQISIHQLADKNTDQKSKVIFKQVVLGGTFDRFHCGHKALISKAFEIGDKVTIGIGTAELYKNKLLSDSIEPFSLRKKSVSEFLKKNSWLKRAKLISFSDFTGGTDKEKNINAIVVSRETFPNALKINQLRDKNELPSLRIVVIEDVLADDGKLISSERIRAGEIDREGKIYSDYFRKTLILPVNLREELRKPLGKVFKTTQQIVGAIFKSPKKPIKIIAVGDIIVESLIKNKINPDVKIIDFRSRRKDILISLGPKKLGKFTNKPGTLNIKTAEKLKKLIQKSVYKKEKSWLTVNGEEDLLTLPAILFAPLGSLVLYGHWQFGVVAVLVTEENKSETIQLLKKFV